MSKRLRLVGAFWIAMSCCGFSPRTSPAADDAPAAAASGSLYDQLADEYLKGNWESLEKQLSPKNKEIEKIAGPQKQDIKYMRDVLAESRPAWWRQCKEKQEFNFRPAVWGRSIRASFDPEAKSNINITSNNGASSAALNWNASDMDNTAEAEHGFSKGDLCDLSVWSVIGSADAWISVPIQLQLNMKDAQKLQLQRFIDFNGNLAGAYYGTPMARRWGLWLFCAAYLDKYSAMTIVNSRKAVGSMFLAEVVAHRAKYPSITLPEALPDEKIEENLCIALKNHIEKHPWTLAEDKNLREQIKAFELLNQRELIQTGKVKLPNGLFVALDPAADEAYQSGRDAWLKRMFAPHAK